MGVPKSYLWFVCAHFRKASGIDLLWSAILRVIHVFTIHVVRRLHTGINYCRNGIQTQQLRTLKFRSRLYFVKHNCCSIVFWNSQVNRQRDSSRLILWVYMCSAENGTTTCRFWCWNGGITDWSTTFGAKSLIVESLSNFSAMSNNRCFNWQALKWCRMVDKTFL